MTIAQILRFCFQKGYEIVLVLGQQGAFNSLRYYLSVKLGILVFCLFTLLSALLLDDQVCAGYSRISFQSFTPLKCLSDLLLMYELNFLT